MTATVYRKCKLCRTPFQIEVGVNYKRTTCSDECARVLKKKSGRKGFANGQKPDPTPEELRAAMWEVRSQKLDAKRALNPRKKKFGF